MIVNESIYDSVATVYYTLRGNSLNAAILYGYGVRKIEIEDTRRSKNSTEEKEKWLIADYLQ